MPLRWTCAPVEVSTQQQTRLKRHRRRLDKPPIWGPSLIVAEPQRQYPVKPLPAVVKEILIAFPGVRYCNSCHYIFSAKNEGWEPPPETLTKPTITPKEGYENLKLTLALSEH